MEENKLLYFLKKHWSKFFFVILACVCGGIWGERFYKGQKINTAQDYFIANQIFERMLSGKAIEIESIAHVEEILSRHPELHPKYDSLLAHVLFAQNNTAKALSYANSSFERVASKLPSFYQSYAQTSFLIGEKKYEDAFEQVKELELSLKENEAHPDLRAFNLLRLLFLAEKNEDLETVQTTWQALQEHPSYSKIAPLFKEGKLSLKDYFDQQLS